MASVNDMPYILKLLEDPSPVVRQEIMQALLTFGLELETVMNTITPPPSSQQRKQITDMLHEHARESLRECWSNWYGLEDDKERLEAALSCLTSYLCQDHQPINLPELLDDLAARYRTWDNVEHPGDAIDLARFLFEFCGIQGAKDNYYSPQNSNLVHVILNKSGLPISLACIYILVGHRLKMSIGGCNWPGHFLALTYTRNNLYVVDCFNGGKAVDEESFLKKQGPSRAAASSLLHHEAGAEIIMQRVLANLTKAYKLMQDSTNQLLMADLLEIHERMTDGAPHS